MSSIPRKSVTGLPLKKYVLDTLNGLIDYLQTHRIQAGKGIDVRETASGYVIGLAQPPSNPPQVERGGGGGGADGIEANVNGGTASITLTGGTGSVNLVGTGDVTISGNTNTGNIEINATGGGGGAVVGMPDYANPLVTSVAYNTTYPSTFYANQDVWLIGMLNTVFDPNNYSLSGHVEIALSNGTVTNNILLQDIFMNVSSNANEIETPVMLPIPRGYSFVLTCGSVTPGLGVKIYPCL